MLSPRTAADLRARSFTYAGQGATASTLPAGYRHLRRERLLMGSDFDAAASALLRWQVPVRSGLRVSASAVAAEPGAVVLMRFGFGPASLRIPCRVVYVVDEPDRKGFAYGTLEGHPEAGEEAFVLTRRGDGAIVFTITAFSNAASSLARLGGPLTRLIQARMTERYLAALDNVRPGPDLG
jgi:uncharacterized protein (UPF0548 family)